MTRFYRLLVALYPRDRRREDGDDMAEMFDDIYRYETESKGLMGRTRLGAATLRDVVGGAVTERLPFFDVLAQDLRYGLRRLRANPTLTVAAVLTLAVGIGAVTAIYSFVYGLVLNPLPYPDVDRVVAIGEVTPRRGLNGEGWTHGAALRQMQALESLDSVAAMTFYRATMTGVGDPADVIGWRATPEFFDVARVRPAIGRVFRGTAADADTVVLGHTFWQRQFGGDPAVVGRSLRLGERQMTVIGVMPRGAEFPMGTDLWAPLELTPEWAASYEGGLRTIGRLTPGATIGQLRAELAPIAAEAAEAAPETHEDTRFEVEPILANMTIYTRSALGFLMGAAAFLLLLVCGNVANMQLAQAAARREEMAMRQALGAPRGRLVRQLLTESVALAMLAAIAGTFLAYWCAAGLRAALAYERWRFYFAGVDSVGVNFSVLAFATSVSLGSVILFGLVPALSGARVDLNQALKQSLTRGDRDGNKLRGGLVVFEVTLSVVLLVGAGLMASSIGEFARFEPGIDTDALTVQLRLTGYSEPAQRRAFFEEAMAEAATVPGIVSVGLTDRIPAGSSGSGSAVEAEPAGVDDARRTRAENHWVGGAYFETLDIPMVSGRGFDERDVTTNASSVVISASLAQRLWPGEPAVGQRLRFTVDPDDAEANPWLTVIGVARDVRRGWNDPRPSPSVYLPLAAQTRSVRKYLLLQAAGDREGIVRTLRERIWSIDDAVVVFAPESIAASIDALASPVRSMSRMVSGMALAALIVCLSGIYALVAHAAGRRTREIGVRMALGARDKQVVRMLVAHGLKTTGVGLIIGLAIAFGLARVLVGMAPNMLSLDARVFLALAAGVLLLAALSSWLPARRAARVDPVTALRAG
jgi:predicted permease